MKWHADAHVSAPPLHEVNPGVPEALSEIVAKMMAKDPDQRYASMEELGRAIKSKFSPKARSESVGAVTAPPGVDEADEATQIEARQCLIDTGLVWQLQGCFGRQAARMIEAGICHRRTQEPERV